MGSLKSNRTYDTLFWAGRYPPLPTLYSENKTPETEDVLESGWIVGCFVLYTSLLVFIPAFNCKEVSLLKMEKLKRKSYQKLTALSSKRFYTINIDQHK